MKHPSKWRETVDPFRLPYRHFRLAEVLGYPHAGNDVFHVRGIYQQREVTAFIKAARQTGADLCREVEIIRRLNWPLAPEVIDFDEADGRFVVTLEKPGERLSVIAGENARLESMAYLYEYGRTLAMLHSIQGDFPPVKDRRFFHPPDRGQLEHTPIAFVWDWLNEHRPVQQQRCFCHGDFHYANLLWQNGRLSAVLDFELAGIGDRDFDIAWAMAVRPGQRFLHTEAEAHRFLEGYASAGTYDWQAVQYHLAVIYAFFYGFAGNEPAYLQLIESALSAIAGTSAR